MLELWTHGLYRATPHRVRNVSKANRISMPFCLDPGYNCSLEPIDKKLIPKIDPRLLELNSSLKRWDDVNIKMLSKDMTYGEYLKFKLISD